MSSMRSAGSPSLAHKRVLQLRLLGTYLRSRANTLNNRPWPDERHSNNGIVTLDDDDAVRPRTLSSPTSNNANEESKTRKRSMRKQRYYGSVELMVSTDSSGKIKNMGRYRVEPADSIKHDIYQGDEQLPMSPIMVEDPETETRWYFRYFLGREHQNFAGIDNQKSPYFLSVLTDETADGARCRAILWQSTGTKKLTFQCNQATLQKPLTAKTVVQKFPRMNEINHNVKEIMDAKLQKELLILEEQEGAVNFKFGVIYALNEQKSDDEMLSNEDGSETFKNFLNLLGSKIQLQGWTKFRGGLDTKTNSTGTTSVYTNYEGHEIMFHVSTMLPYSKGNKQQVERKRHIGNDIVIIIFEEGGDPTKPNFKPSFMKSQFTHIFAVITHDQTQKCYRLWVYSEESVPAYGPALPTHSEFYDENQFRDFILTKLINGEKAAFRSQVFAEKRHRTTDALIKDMYMEYLKKELNRGPIQKATEGAIRHVKSPRNKELDQNLLEFLRLGEHLKLTKSLSGEAPNILTDGYRKQPWEPQLLCADLTQYEILSSDSWSNRSLIFATENSGTLFINEGVCTTIFDISCQVQQLNVLENFGIMLLRCEKGKDSYLTVFSLSHLRSCIRSGKPLQRLHCLENRISGTKGCQMYTVTGNQSFRLSVAIVNGRKLILLRWKLSQITQLPASSGLAANFEITKDISLHDDVISLCVFESGLQAATKAAVLTKNDLNLIDFADSRISSIYRPVQPKMGGSNLLASSDVDSEDILLTDHSIKKYDKIKNLPRATEQMIFTDTTLVFDLFDEESRPLSISWTSNPKTIAYCFPFVIGFGSDTIEIRLGVNGNLFASLYMPGVYLLAAKEDIFFATYDSPWPLNDVRYNRNGKSLNNQNQQTSKPTCSLFKISVKNLLKGGGQSNVNSKNKPSPYTTGSFTPILSRFIFSPCSSNDSAYSSQFHNTDANVHRCAKGSVASDSGCSRGMCSTEDSMELVDSSPPSPFNESRADVLL